VAILAALAGVCARAAGGGATAAGPSQPAPGPAYLVVELPSRRVVAEGRPDVLGNAVPPGSVIKMATLIAAIEDGLVDDSTRIACRRSITVDGKRLTCVHPDPHRPLSATEALGYSCNVFFATVSQRLRRSSLDATLVRMGLPPLAAEAPTASGALGLSGLRATPRQLLEAFLRVVGSSRVDISLADTTRGMLRRGLEMAARSGTASALAAAGFSGLAKTGTAPMPGGGYCGIVTALVNSELPTHAIVVVVPGGAGADAAELAARLLARHGAPRRSETVRVGIARRGGGYDVRPMALETYVSRVVAGEMDEAAFPALEAMAITARTFVAANRGRHAAGGFDVCDLTHCQVLARATRATDAAALATSGQVLVDQGQPAQVFYSSWCGGHTETPSHAWPGARDLAWLPARPDPTCADEPPWTVDLAEPRLRRALEAAGLKGSGVSVMSVASRHASGRVAQLRVAGMAPDLVDANAFRTAAGRLLGWQMVKSTMFDVRRSSSGYVLTGRGSGHGVGLCIRGAMNRASRGAVRAEILAAYFPGLTVASRVPGPPGEDLRRPEASYLFTAAAHFQVAIGPGGGQVFTMEAGSEDPASIVRGMPGPRATLDAYGVSAPESPAFATAPAHVGSGEAMPKAKEPSIRVHLPEAERRFLTDVRDLATRLLDAIARKLGVPAPPGMDLRFHPTVEAYTRATGQPWWTAARTTGTRIDLLPLGVLQQRGILEPTLQHEFVHVLADPSLSGRPLWVREGLAMVLAGELTGQTTGRGEPRGHDGSACPPDADLRSPASADAWRRAYQAAGRCASRALSTGRRWQDLR
jgi:SpoIID/LytB domain protein